MKIDTGNSRYLKKGDCGNGIVVTIAGFTNENVAPANDKPDMKWVMSTRETKPLVLNRTNHDAMAELFGTDDVDKWVGKRVTLFNDASVLFNGVRGGIRVRMSATKAPSLQESMAAIDEQAERAAAEEGADSDEDIPW